MDIDNALEELNEIQPDMQLRCPSCHQVGHLRRTSRLCPLNNRATEDNTSKAMQTDVLPERHNLGGMSHRCPNCDAFMWVQERAEGGISTARYQLCCGLEKYVVQPFEPTPQVIAGLLKNNDSKSVEFKRNIRAYNNALGFTSMGVNLDSIVQSSRGGAYAFRNSWEYLSSNWILASK